jgi:heptosyltransferase-1
VVAFDRSRVSNVLIVKMSSIGDVVHALPVATALRRRYPQLRLSWALEEWVAPLLTGHAAIDRLITFPATGWRHVGASWASSFGAAVRNLRAESYDVAIDLQSLAKSSLVSLLSRAPLRIGHAWQREGARFVSRAVPHRPGAHVVEEYLACAAALGASVAEVRFDLPVQTAARARAVELLKDSGVGGGPLIAINPSASRARKCWPLERWVEVADGLADAGELVLVGTAAEAARHREIARRAGAHVRDLTGRTTLAELVAVLDRSALHIAHDTGTAHVAAALGTPVVGIYGPTDPRRLAPYGQAHLVQHRDGLCAPTCPRLCPYARRCLAAVTPAAVVRTALSSLSAVSSAERATPVV